MQEVGAYEAKTHLPKLLERVEKGERFIITRHGQAVAELVPISRHDPGKIRRAIQDLKRFQKTHRLDGVSVRELIAEGRK